MPSPVPIILFRTLQLAERYPDAHLLIGELMQAYDHTLAELFAGTQFGLAEKIFNRDSGQLVNGDR